MSEKKKGKKIIHIKPFDYEVTRKTNSISLKPCARIIDPFKKEST